MWGFDFFRSSWFCGASMQRSVTWMLSILAFPGGAIRAVRSHCRRAGCRNFHLWALIRVGSEPTWGQLWFDIGRTLAALFADFWQPLGRFWGYSGVTLGQLCANFAPSSGRRHIDFFEDCGPTSGRLRIDFAAILGQSKTFWWRL